MQQHRLSRTPDSPKLVPVTASYVTPEIRSLPPLVPAYLAGWDYRDKTGRQAGIPGVCVIRRSSSTVNPSGDTHASPTW